MGTLRGRVQGIQAVGHVVAAEGVTLGPRPHPALAESRQLRIALARLLGALRLPAGDEGALIRRPQRRSGARGVYAIGLGGAS